MADETPDRRVTVTYLAMDARPDTPPPDMPYGQRLAIIAASSPPTDYFLYLYRTVGADWEWTDWLKRPRADLDAFVGDENVVIHTLLVDGWPGGFFMLDRRTPGTCDVAYFGLVPQAIGRGLGTWFLGQAIATAWQQPGVERLTVNTCTLDHPAALGLYQRLGFRPVDRRELLIPPETALAAPEG